MPLLTIPCPYCGGDAVRMETSSHVYRSDYGPIYDCRPCDAYVGTHRLTGDPLGTPANRVLRAARKACHASFDRLWREDGPDGRMTWRQAYEWLSRAMGVDKQHAHIAMFNLEQCKALLRLLDQRNR